MDDLHPLNQTKVESRDEKGFVRQIPTEGVALAVIAERTIAVCKYGDAYQGMLLNINVFKGYDKVKVVSSTPLLGDDLSAIKSLIMCSVELLCSSFDRTMARQQSKTPPPGAKKVFSN